MAAWRRVVATAKQNHVDAFGSIKTVISDTHFQCRNFHVAAILEKSRKRWQWRRDRKPANTQLASDNEELIEKRRTYGGGSKIKAVTKSKGSYLLKSQGWSTEVPITDVIHSDTNKEYIVKKIMTKGTIVKLDATEFIKMFESNENARDNLTSESDASNENNNQSSPGERIDENVEKLIRSGYLYGKITSRPGQVGLCDGYILEGEELQSIMEKLSLSAQSTDL